MLKMNRRKFEEANSKARAKYTREIFRLYAPILISVRKDSKLLALAIEEQLKQGNPVDIEWLVGLPVFNSLNTTLIEQLNQASYQAELKADRILKTQEAIANKEAPPKEDDKGLIAAAIVTAGVVAVKQSLQKHRADQTQKTTQMLLKQIVKEANKPVKTITAAKVQNLVNERIQVATSRTLMTINTEVGATTGNLVISNAAEETAAKSNSLTEGTPDIPEPTYWVWNTRLDSKTCEVCQKLQGEVFPSTLEFRPAHPNCRCYPTPL